MDPRLRAYAERQAPRYTSYPTAPHFSAAVDDSVVARWLADIPEADSISLYIHVPYCRQLCWYCGCNTYAARRDEPVLDYVTSVLREIDLAREALGRRRVVEIHWGGGTPNILEAPQFAQIIERISGAFDTSTLAHHAIELDPRYVDTAKASAYAAAGVNRVSLGVQDLNDRVQQAIGRVQPLAVVEQTVETLRGAGIAEINFDLMYGLPHQGVADVQHSVELSVAMRPNRIALFGYAHVPWFKKRQRLIPDVALPGMESRFEQAEAARIKLQEHGYVAIGLDHFALPNDELARAAKAGALRRSFQGYVIEQAPALVGLGPSAISTLPQGYAQNHSEPGAWAASIANDRLPVARGHELSEDDRLRRRLIETIMCDFEGNLGPLGGARACAAELAALAPMIRDGLVTLNSNRIVLSEAAYPLCRVVGAAFDIYAARAQARHSKAV
jgi:oxygen-independent coproporphyrinogen-3 oxidase